MNPNKLCQIIEQLGGKYIATVRLETLSGERFELLAIMSGATVESRILVGDDGPMVIRSFERVVDGATVIVEHRRAANLTELRSAM